MMETRNKPEIKVITIEEDILKENALYAAENRALLQAKGIYTVNLLSSPGSGKTTLLVETLQRLKDKVRCGVIEGDQHTSNDAARVAATGVPVMQVNAPHSCHLDAALIQKALKDLPLDELDLLFIENVGNLICPAEFDLGEDEKVAVMSVTEGEDKPEKYPLLFHLAQVTLLTKMDLLPHLRFDLELCKRYLRKVNPRVQIIETSAFTHQGLDEWLAYLLAKSRR